MAVVTMLNHAPMLGCEPISASRIAITWFEVSAFALEAVFSVDKARQ